MALIASANLVLVLFDLSYIPLRNFWLQGRIRIPLLNQTLKVPLPPIAKWYDRYKGIEPHRDTDAYLQKVDELEKMLGITGSNPLPTQEILTQLRSQQTAQILADLRRRSEEMVDTNPFQVANKTGTLEKIKNRMREHVTNQENSAKQSFRQFWSENYLELNGVKGELNFFNEEIRPLIETNYYRPIGENGEFVDRFWKLDLPFVILFGLEFLARTWLISRRHVGVNWRDAMLWRWYDIFLIVPFSLVPFLRYCLLLRIIPVTIRLNQAEIIDLERIQKQVSQGFVASIAEDVTEVVVVRVINQIQSSIRDGDLSRLLSKRDVRPYVDINNTDEVAALTKLVTQLVVYQVLPKIRPDLEALLQHNLKKAIEQSPAYQSLERLPGLGELQHQLTERVTKEIIQAIYDGLNAALEEDPVGEQLFKRLIEHLTEVIGTEIQAKQTLPRIQSLLTDLLEEIKINYVENMSEQDLEEILEQTRAIRQIAQQ
ncbi:MAG: hypothetical protein Fur006_28140 [Coleofasciculaceae cyanobacterium]